MRVALADASVAPVDENFRVLTLGNFPRAVDRFALRPVDRRGSLSSFRLYRPPVFMRDHMLIPSFSHLPFSKFAAKAIPPIC
jgi:hypothetical protein